MSKNVVRVLGVVIYANQSKATKMHFFRSWSVQVSIEVIIYNEVDNEEKLNKNVTQARIFCRADAKQMKRDSSSMSKI